MKRILCLFAAIMLLLNVSVYSRGGSGGGHSSGGSHGGSMGGSSSSHSSGGSMGGTSSRSSSSSSSSPSRSSGGSMGGTSSRSSISSSSSSSAPTSRSYVNSSGKVVTMRSDFGGRQLSSPSEYTSSHGTPQSSERMTSGGSTVVVNHYGGASDAYMLGYLSGSRPWHSYTPFSGYFYYSSPRYVTGADGVVSVYPPEFQWGMVIVSVLIFGAIGAVIYYIFRKAKPKAARSSFS